MAYVWTATEVIRLSDESDTLSLLILDFQPSAEVMRLVGSEMNAIFRRLSNFLRNVLDVRWRDALEETSPAFGLADLIAKRWERIGRVRLILITNRELSERVDGRPADELDGRAITYSVWDIRRSTAKRPSATGARTSTSTWWTTSAGRSRSLLHSSPKRTTSPILRYPREGTGRHLRSVGCAPSRANVRVFLQSRGKVNKGIRVTLENEPSMLFAYNNGITVTAEEVDIVNDGRQASFSGA